MAENLQRRSLAAHSAMAGELLDDVDAAAFARPGGQAAFAGALLLEGWREGRDGALRSGMEHGAWCLGCCWALMAALFALGAMSIAWMALISVLIAGERLLPWRALTTTGVASLLAVMALGVAVAPARVPMLTIPRGGMAMQAMESSPRHRMRLPPRAPMRPRMSSMPR